MTESIDLHKNNRGKWRTSSCIEINKDNLHLVYTPGVGDVCKKIAENAETVDELTPINNPSIVSELLVLLASIERMAIRNPSKIVMLSLSLFCRRLQ